MAEDNVQIVRRAYEAFNRGDFDRAVEFLAPDVEWQTPPNLPDPGVWRGRDEVVTRMAELLEKIFDELQVQVEELIEADDRVVALVRYKGRGSSTGLTVEGSGLDSQIWTLRDGKVVRVEMHGGTHAALEAAGLEHRGDRREDPRRGT
jgi:ketosteroid isomerase-like protein